MAGCCRSDSVGREVCYSADSRGLGLAGLRSAFGLVKDPLDRPDSATHLLGGGDHAGAVLSGFQNRPPDLGCILRAAQRLALRSGPLQTRFDPLLYHSPLELREDPGHLEESFACGRGRVDPLLVEAQMDALGMDLVEKAHQVL